VNSRSSHQASIWRRRKCLNCTQVFTTYESINLNAILKIKKSDVKKPSPYSRIKLQISLQDACAHLYDPLGAKIEYLTNLIEKQALEGSIEEIISIQDLKDIVSETLKRFDPTAFIKYSSAHGQDVQNFIKT
jgi:transcriptional regulator NrdR family protein